MSLECKTFDQYARDYAKQLADQLPECSDADAARWARVLGIKRPPQPSAA